MARVVSLFLPTFPTDRIRRRAGAAARPASEAGPSPDEPVDVGDRPLVTALKIGSRRVVAAVDARARLIGLKPGQALAQAQASVPNLAIVDATPDDDRRALDEFAGWCLRYAPVVQADGPDGVLIDITGAAHLHGDELALADDLVARVGRSGFAVRVGIADTPALGWAVARYGASASRPVIVAPDQGEAALRTLPIAALRLSEATCAALALVGIERVGELARYPRAQLTLRFGRELAQRYDRALGHAPEPLVPLVPRTVVQARAAFAEPLGHLDALATALARLLPELCETLGRRGEGLRRLDAIFRRVDGSPLSLRIGTAAPTRDPGHLAKLLDSRLPEIDPGFGIDEIALVASRVELQRERQTISRTLVPAADGGALALGPLVDKLGVRLGEARVYRLAPVESRVPERSVGRVPALSPPVGVSWPAALPRPSRILDPPEPVSATALVPDNAPLFFVWRRVRYIVRHADGPERVRGEWWRSDAEIASLRDYYRVEDQKGRRFWLFRDAPTAEGGRWWMHGRFS
jgi:protein ImuB